MKFDDAKAKQLGTVAGAGRRGLAGAGRRACRQLDDTPVPSSKKQAASKKKKLVPRVSCSLAIRRGVLVPGLILSRGCRPAFRRVDVLLRRECAGCVRVSSISPREQTE